MGEPQGIDPPRREKADAFTAYQAGELARSEWLSVFANLVSVLGSGFVALVAYDAATYRGSENLAKFGLMLLGCPFLALQAFVLSPLSMFYAGVIKWHRPQRSVGWRYALAIILPLVTLVSIIVGMIDWRWAMVR